MTPILAGGVIAAGEGSRLRALGSSKPLVPVAGVPLIGHVLSNFAAAGIATAAVIVNADGQECAAYVRERFATLVGSLLVRTTASSLESFRRVLDALPAGRVLVSTVDAFCPREDFLAFVRAAQELPEEATVLAVTSFVADEKPLWVRLGPDGAVSEVGGSSGEAVTAGIYVIPERVRKLSARSTLGRLREFLAAVHQAGEPVRAVRIPIVIDVDRPEDLRLAERLAQGADLAAARLPS